MKFLSLILFPGLLSAQSNLMCPSCAGTLQGRGLRVATSGQVKTVNSIMYYENGDNFASMLTAIGSRNVRIVMDTVAAITTNTTIPVNVTVAFTPFGGFNVATTKTLTILSLEPPGRFKVFYSSGTGNTKVPMGVSKFPEWWGAIPDGVTSSNAAVQAAVASRGEVNFDTGTYILSSTINLVDLQIIGKGIRAVGGLQTILKFNALDTAPAFISRLADNSSIQSNAIKGVNILPNSWTAVTGSRGYGLNIEAPITMTDVFVSRFFKSGIFLHGGVAGNGPYNSVFTNVYSDYNGEHGILVGTGANVLTFIQPYTAYNGATAYGVAPVAAGVYDGFRVQRDSAGNPGVEFQSYLMESLRIIGGNAFANSQYGWNFSQISHSILEPGYSEGNKIGKQIYLGNDIQSCFVNIPQVSGDSGGVVNNASYYRRDNILFVQGKLVGQSSTRENWSFKNIKTYFGEAPDSTSQAFIQYDTAAAVKTLNIFANGTSSVEMGNGTNGLTVNSAANNLFGNLLFTSDNTHDIGASGATRPRDFFLGRNASITGTLAVTGGTTFTGNHSLTRSAVGSSVTATIENTDNTNGASHARLSLLAGGTAGGDPFILFSVPGGANYSIGADNSASGDMLTASAASTLGTANGWTVSSTGIFNTPNTTEATSATVAGATHAGGIAVVKVVWAGGGVRYPNGATAQTWNDSGASTLTLTGCTTSPTVTAVWNRVGHIVTLQIPAVTATSNTTACTLTGLSANARPLTQQEINVNGVEDNGIVYASGVVQIAASGTITLLFNATAILAPTATFTNSGVKGWTRALTLSYQAAP